MTILSPEIESACLSLQVVAPGGCVRSHELRQGNVLVVGSSPACGLRLESPEIAGMHCTVEYNDNGITVRDWSTQSGTLIDGRKIEEARITNAPFELRIAGFKIDVSLQSATTPTHAHDAWGAATDEFASPEPDHSRERHDNSYSRSEPLQTSLAEEARSVIPDDPQAGVEATDDEPWNRDFDPWDSPEQDDVPTTDSSRSPVSNSYHRDEFCHDTSDLLQAEIDFLRSEVAERDERLRELERVAEFSADTCSAEETISAPEAERLVARLEQLLVELEQSDVRLASLNELLRTSEEAVQTCEEERRQLESWVSEVDRRVGQWEGEWHAERDAMSKTIDELTGQRDRAEHRLATGAAGDSSGSARDELVQELREEYARLKSLFLSTEQERNQLQSKMQEASFTDVEQRVTATVEAALREERLHLAQEKAAIAREKADLGTKQRELEDHLGRKSPDSDSADQRIRAFREHLRELHENEPNPPQGPTLSQRMGKLWRKLEGRPLDTD